MTHNILNSLLRLLALAASMNLRALNEGGVRHIEKFLRRHIGVQEWPGFLEFYLQSLKEYSLLLRSKPEGDVFFSASEDVRESIVGLERELDRHERLLVLIHLLEFLASDGIISEEESRFLDMLAQVFSIPEQEKEFLLLLLLDNCPERVTPANCLVIIGSEPDSGYELEGAWIDQHKPQTEAESHVRVIPGFIGKLVFLYLHDRRLIVAHYQGNGDVSIDGQPADTNQLYIIHPESSVKSASFSLIQYKDLARFFQRENEFSSLVLNGNKLAYQANDSCSVQPFSFSIQSGYLIGIIGDESTGKSRLLQILAGQLSPTSGSISLNNYNLFLERFKVQGVIGYLPAQNLLMENLSVFNNLLINARLSLGGQAHGMVKQKVEKLLQKLGLAEVRDALVGDPLEGGITTFQRKILQLGFELLRDPSILIIDEPVAGLHAHEIAFILDLLRAEAIQGKLVLLGFETPPRAFYKALDLVWIFDTGGFLVYQGSPQDAIAHLKNNSFVPGVTEKECNSCANSDPQVIPTLIQAPVLAQSGNPTGMRRINPSEWHRLYIEQVEPGLPHFEGKRVLPGTQARIPTELDQLIQFTKRNMLSKLPAWGRILLLLLSVPLIAVVLAFLARYSADNTYLFSENRNLPQYLFLSILCMQFIGMMTGIPEIIEERFLAERENSLFLSWFSYINSKLIYLFPLSALQSLLYVLAGNFILGIQGMTVTYWLVLFSSSCFANLLGLNLSAGLSSRIQAYILVPILLVPQVLFSGALIPFDDFPSYVSNRVYVPYAGDLTASRWAYEALAVSQFKDNAYEKKLYSFEQAISDYSFKSSYLIPQLQEKVDETMRYKGDSTYIPQASLNLSLIRNELSGLEAYPSVYPFEYYDSLQYPSFSENMGEELMGYLTYLKLQFVSLRDQTNTGKDSLLTMLQNEFPDGGVAGLRSKHHNSRIAELVLNRSETQRVKEFNGRIIQKKEPVFVYPHSDIGRAQFFAPVKRVNGQFVDTLWYNLSILWIMVFILYLLLITDALKSMMQFAGKKQQRQRAKELA